MKAATAIYFMKVNVICSIDDWKMGGGLEKIDKHQQRC